MKHIFLAMALSLSATFAAAQDKLPLSAISDYMNGLTTLKAPFTQFNGDGSTSTGTLFVHRPGRMRFEYDPPNSAVVVAGSGAVVIHDPKSNQPPESYPLKRTPLSIILERNIDLTRTNMVTGHTSDGTTTTVTAQDPVHPEYGNIQMVYTSSPVELRQWIVTDDTGQQTTVILGDLAKDGRVPDILFNIQREMRNWGN